MEEYIEHDNLEKEVPAEKMAEESAEGKKEKKRVYVEELEVSGQQLWDRIKELAHESNVRRVVIKNREGRTVLDVPLWIAAAGGLTAVMAFPIISAIGVIGGLLAGIRLEIEREEEIL
ncbi:MAG: DUF4342 domain-containing protein [Actinomycetota bacterium]|nr:DUF4342 domain-containing protein [Actinomycetota bacterium]